MFPASTHIVLAAADAGPDMQSAGSWTRRILSELGRTQASEFLFATLGWALLGALLGLVLAVGVYILFRHNGWYDVQSRLAVWGRRLVFAGTILLAVLLFGVAGFWQGVIHGSERVLRKSQLGTEVFPRVAGVVADTMAGAQMYLAAPTNTALTNITSQLEEFATGKWELDAPLFLKQLDRLEHDAVNQLVSQVEQSALARAPQLKGGIGEKLLHYFLGEFGALLVNQKVASEAKRWGADRLYQALRDRLETEAARAGDPRTISRAEIAEFIVSDGIVPALMQPIRSTARTQQAIVLLLALPVLFLPPLAFRLLRRKATPAPAAPPAMSAV